ncbi:hypothetical protein PM082_018232 [Marasmius tenuissimus]|nr:hypothetical protein PM082_018232 [Marasmius tenuissimus]
MEEFEEELRDLNIYFSYDGNRIRFLRYLPATSDEEAIAKGIPLLRIPLEASPELVEDPEYMLVLEDDVVATA